MRPCFTAAPVSTVATSCVTVIIVCASCASSCGWWAGKLTFSAGGLVESAGPGPPLLADLGPRLLCRPLDGGLISLLEVHKTTTEAGVTFIYLCFAFMRRRKKNVRLQLSMLSKAGLMQVFVRKSIHEAVINHTNTKAITRKELQEFSPMMCAVRTRKGLARFSIKAKHCMAF